MRHSIDTLLYMSKLYKISFAKICALIVVSFGLSAEIPFTWASAKAATIDASKAFEMVKRADEFRFPAGDVRFRVKVIDFKKGKADRVSEYRVLSDGQGKSLVETLKPERQKGRKLLMADSDLWFYSPDIRKPVRVSLQQRLTGEVANGDLANTNFAGDYSATFVGEESQAGRRLTKLKLKSKSKTATYASINYLVDAATGAPVSAEFLSTSGKVMKRGFFEKYATVLGKRRLTEMKIEDAIVKTKMSRLQYSDFSSEAISAMTFSKESIGR